MKRKLQCKSKILKAYVSLDLTLAGLNMIF